MDRSSRPPTTARLLERSAPALAPLGRCSLHFDSRLGGCFAGLVVRPVGARREDGRDEKKADRSGARLHAEHGRASLVRSNRGSGGPARLTSRSATHEPGPAASPSGMSLDRTRSFVGESPATGRWEGAVRSTGPSRAHDPPTMHDALGHSGSTPISWTPGDVVVFAAAVGADSSTDLDFLDLSRGPLVLPTFLGARVFRAGQALNLWEPWAFDPHAYLHPGLRHVVSRSCSVDQRWRRRRAHRSHRRVGQGLGCSRGHRRQRSASTAS